MCVMNYPVGPCLLALNGLFGPERHKAKSGDTNQFPKYIMRNLTSAENVSHFIFSHGASCCCSAKLTEFSQFLRFVAESITSTRSANTPVRGWDGGGGGASDKASG